MGTVLETLLALDLTRSSEEFDYEGQVIITVVIPSRNSCIAPPSRMGIARAAPFVFRLLTSHFKS